MLVQVLLFPAMKPEENKPAGGAIKPQVRVSPPGQVHAKGLQ